MSEDEKYFTGYQALPNDEVLLDVSPETQIGATDKNSKKVRAIQREDLRMLEPELFVLGEVATTAS